MQTLDCRSKRPGALETSTLFQVVARCVSPVALIHIHLPDTLRISLHRVDTFASPSSQKKKKGHDNPDSNLSHSLFLPLAILVSVSLLSDNLVFTGNLTSWSQPPPYATLTRPSRWSPFLRRSAWRSFVPFPQPRLAPTGHTLFPHSTLRRPENHRTCGGAQTQAQHLQTPSRGPLWSPFRIAPGQRPLFLVALMFVHGPPLALAPRLWAVHSPCLASLARATCSTLPISVQPVRRNRLAESARRENQWMSRFL